MTRDEAKALIVALVALREGASDEQALKAVAVYPAWREGVAYAEGQRVRYNGELYRVIMAHDAQAAWTPDAAPSLFARVLVPEDGSVPEWQQPDSTNGYAKGDKVTHGGATWESLVDNNVWEPGATGTESLWQKI